MRFCTAALLISSSYAGTNPPAMRGSAEIMYSNNIPNSYHSGTAGDVCDYATPTDPGKQYKDATLNSPVVDFSQSNCSSNDSGWAASVPLNQGATSSGPVSWYCVDSNGTAKIEPAALGDSVYVCAP
jgi:hypothetical protein